MMAMDQTVYSLRSRAPEPYAVMVPGEVPILLVLERRLGVLTANGVPRPRFSPQESCVLATLLRRPNIIFEVGQLVRAMYGANPEGEPESGAENTLRVVLCVIRRKLVAAGLPGTLIKNVYGVGYCVVGYGTPIRPDASGPDASGIAAVLHRWAEPGRKQ